MKVFLFPLLTSIVYDKVKKIEGHVELPDGNIHISGTNTSIVPMGCSTRVSKSTTLSSQSVMKFDIDYPSTTCTTSSCSKGLFSILQILHLLSRSHSTMWQQQYDPFGQYRRRKILRFSFLSIRGHPCGNETTSADVPEGAKIDVFTQESCAFVVLSEILGFSRLYEARVCSYHVF